MSSPDYYIQQAKALMEWAADPQVWAQAEALIASGSHRWRADPEVPYVLGLVRIDQPSRADLVIYLDDDDFEESDTFWDGTSLA